MRAATVSKSKTLNQHHNDDAAADDDEDDDDLFPVVAVHEVYADEISSWFEGPGLKSCWRGTSGASPAPSDLVFSMFE